MDRASYKCAADRMAELIRDMTDKDISRQQKEMLERLARHAATNYMVRSKAGESQ